MPIICDIALTKGIRPERPCAVASVASQVGITCSPIAAAVVAFVTISNANGYGVTIPQTLMVTIPACLAGLLLAALASFRRGKDLDKDPEYQKRIQDPKIHKYIYGSDATTLDKIIGKNAKTAVFIFLAAIIVIVGLAFCQMVHALTFLNGNTESFIRGFYDFEALKGYEETVSRILCRRQTDASADWKAFGESLSGQAIPDFDESGYREEYLSADAGGKDGTVLGRYILAALAQKSMVTNKIARSKNPLAGISVEYDGKKLPGIRDYLKLIRISERGKNDKVAKNP
jgi:hypothetical protein